MNYNKLKLAVSAGARGISTNKKLQGAIYAEFPKGKLEEKQELSYYQAEIILMFLSDCITDEGINVEKLASYVDNIDKYEIKGW